MSHIPERPLERVTVPSIQRWREEGRRIVKTTACDPVTALIADLIVDFILVGYSVGNVCLVFESTLPISTAMMNDHLEAVSPRGLVPCS